LPRGRAIEGSQLKLAKLLEPPAAADVTAANLDIDRAPRRGGDAESGPSPAAVLRRHGGTGAGIRRASISYWARRFEAT